MDTAGRPDAGAGAARRRCSSAAGGATVLVSGDAGVGKTRLTAVLAQSAGRARAARRRGAGRAPRPTARCVEALRGHLRAHPGGLGRRRPAARPPRAAAARARRAGRATADRADAVRGAARRARRDRARPPRRVVLDDLQWSDEATLEVLAALGERCRLPLLVVGVYRSDGLPRQHPIRRLRHDLRRAGRLEELVLRPLEPRRDRRAAARRRSAASPRRRSRAPIHDRTEGLPFFVEELAGALRVSGALTPGRRGLELAGDGDVPLPDTVRDAVLISTSELSGRRAQGGRGRGRGGRDASTSRSWRRCRATTASTELLERGLVRERTPAPAPSGTRSRARRCTPTSRGRAAARCTARSPRRSSGAGRAEPRRRAALARRARGRAGARGAAARGRRLRAPCTPTATRPSAYRQALELWPDERRRGPPRRAAGGLRRLLPARRRAGRRRPGVARAGRRRAATAAWSPTAQRRRAAVLELKGDREHGASRRAARGRRRVRGDRPARPRRRSSGSRSPTSGGSRRATARRSSSRGRPSATPTAPAASTCASARSGSRAWRAPSSTTTRPGLEIVRHGLALALEHDLTAVAAELYQRLSVTLYESADFRRAEEALDTALELCEREPGRGHDRRLRVLHGLRAARARRVVARDPDVPRDDRRRHRRCSSPRACSARSTPPRAATPPRGGCSTSSLAVASRNCATTT